MSWEHAAVEVDGTRLANQRTGGSGPVLILLQSGHSSTIQAARRAERTPVMAVWAVQSS